MGLVYNHKERARQCFESAVVRVTSFQQSSQLSTLLNKRDQKFSVRTTKIRILAVQGNIKSPDFTKKGGYIS